MFRNTLRAVLASSILLVPVAAEAQQHWPRDRDGMRQRHVEQARGWSPGRGDLRQRHTEQAQRYRQWRRGERFDPRYARHYAQIDYRRYRGLRPPPRGYRYVRSGNDAVLVGIATGIVAAVIANAVR